MDKIIKSNDNHEIFLKIWKVENSIGIIHILHGMREYIEKYGEFALYLNSKGYTVIGQDHRGHGNSMEKGLGFFASKNGWNLVVEDVKVVNDYISNNFKCNNIYLLGHSMGSFILRDAVKKYNLQVKGAIISGTGNPKKLKILGGILLVKLAMLFKGKKYKSQFFENLIFRGYTEKFKNFEVKSWLTSDKEKIDDFSKYNHYDELMPLIFYKDLFKGILHVTDKLHFNIKIPLYIFSGNDDPVGNFGREVNQVITKYSNYTDVKSKLYDNGRHEMLNEVNREDVYNDILKWIDNVSS